MSGKETQVEENISKVTGEEVISVAQPKWGRVGAMEVMSDGQVLHRFGRES